MSQGQQGERMREIDDLTDKMTDLLWWDARVSYQIFRFSNDSSLIMSITRFVNIFVDDGPFIGLMACGWLGSLFLKWVGILGSDSQCLPTAFSELYFRFMMWVVTESILKLLLQKQRPGHYHRTSSNVRLTLQQLREQQKVGVIPAKGVMIPGDQYSLPSGHSLRAFACARILIKDPLLSTAFGVNLIFGDDGDWGSIFLLVFAATAAYARVALGKHSILDVVFGSLLGVFMVDVFEEAIGDEGRWQYQQACLTYFTLIGLHCIFDLMRKSDASDLFGLRSTLGFMDTEHQVAFIAGPVVGSWIFALGSTTCQQS